MNFGALRVLNDDSVAGGKGFGTHPHSNMEIISIPLSGNLEHKDSMGNTTLIKAGEVQVMSAGTGVKHSEYNQKKDEKVEFLQIWIIPNAHDTPPRYDQIELSSLRVENDFYQIISPNAEDQGMWIHQNAWFHMGEFTADTELVYELKDKNNGVYAFMLEGEGTMANELISKRDGIGISEAEKISFNLKKDSKILLIEVPLTF